jgi:hypothetical protein
MYGQPRPWWHKWLAGNDRNERVKRTPLPLYYQVPACSYIVICSGLVVANKDKDNSYWICELIVSCLLIIYLFSSSLILGRGYTDVLYKNNTKEQSELVAPFKFFVYKKGLVGSIPLPPPTENQDKGIVWEACMTTCNHHRTSHSSSTIMVGLCLIILYKNRTEQME